MAAGSILRAAPSTETVGQGHLVDAVDPVAVTSRSLTRPVSLIYLDAPEDVAPDVELVATPVIPGQPGPASPTEE